MEGDAGKHVINVDSGDGAPAQQILADTVKAGAAVPAPGARTKDGDAPPQPHDRQSASQSPGAFRPADLAQTATTMMNLMFQPSVEALASINRFWTEQFRVWTGTSKIAPEENDHRFDDPAWREMAYHRIAMQTHLSLRKWIDEWVDTLAVDHKSAEHIRFIASQLNEALAPSNWLNNPAAVKRYIETGGASAVRGFQHVIEDLVRNEGMPATVKRDALKVGRDMATTPGQVVYRSDAFELIQYAPATKEVHARPFLMVAPQFNRYYFYDLSERKSLIRFAVDSGLQTFTISWRNPDLPQRDWNFDTYIAAIEEAVDVVREITGSSDVNIEGGCIAGMIVVALLADLARRGEKKIHSATLLVTQLDTSVETQLVSLATPATMQMARTMARTKGILPGSQMGLVFSFLRPNDLVWNYWVNNYLLGNDPPTFDVLAWNADTTRMASGFYVDLIDMVEHNPFVHDAFKVRGEPVAVGAIDCDQFWLTGLTDHITPWRACYASSRLLGGKREFVVSDGGHIQSMISSPNNPKAKYLVNDAQPASADAWLEGATEQSSSWWLLWRTWITRRSGRLQKARGTLGSRTHRPLADAPGTYVFE